ncbi:MAG: hotdog fold thioesterase [Hyphomicrobiaceae bacterium]
MTERPADQPEEAAVTPLEVAAHMRSVNPMMQDWGMDILEVTPGYARLAMTVRPDMSNTFGTCHGGITFAFADMCLGIAANSYNVCRVTASSDVQFLAPIPFGTRVIGLATEAWRGPRNGFYDARVENGEGAPLSSCEPAFASSAALWCRRGAARGAARPAGKSIADICSAVIEFFWSTPIMVLWRPIRLA